MTVWNNAKPPTQTLLQCRQALNDIILTADEHDFRNGDYGPVIEKALRTDTLTREGLHKVAKQRLAALMTRQLGYIESSPMRRPSYGSQMHSKPNM
jgi:hypothetical protein